MRRQAARGPAWRTQLAGHLAVLRLATWASAFLPWGSKSSSPPRSDLARCLCRMAANRGRKSSFRARDGPSARRFFAANELHPRPDLCPETFRPSEQRFDAQSPCVDPIHAELDGLQFRKNVWRKTGASRVRQRPIGLRPVRGHSCVRLVCHSESSQTVHRDHKSRPPAVERRSTTEGCAHREAKTRCTSRLDEPPFARVAWARPKQSLRAPARNRGHHAKPLQHPFLLRRVGS